MANFTLHMGGGRLSELGRSGASPVLTPWEKQHLDNCAECMHLLKALLKSAIQVKETEKATRLHKHI
jgi:hypothetical protein